MRTEGMMTEEPFLLRTLAPMVTSARKAITQTPNRTDEFGVPRSAISCHQVILERAVVARVTVALDGYSPSGITVDGMTEQVASDGAPAHARETAWLKPPTGLTDNVYDAVGPAVTVAGDCEEEESVKSAPAPDIDKL